MPNSGETISIVLVTGEFLLGILVNGFIAMVNSTDWVRSKKLLTSDIILVSLAISRIGLVSIITWKSYLVMNDIYVFIFDGVLRTIDIFLVLTHSSSIWFGTVLSIFYFLKIAKFSNPFFLWMKWRIDRMIYMLLGGPLIVYLFILFSVMKTMYCYSSSFLFSNKKGNDSQEFQVNEPLFIIFQLFFGFLSFIPFTLTLFSFSLLILSLWRHTRQMQLNATGSRDPKIEAHVRAMKAVSSFILLFLLYYIGLCFNYGSYLTNSKVFFLLSMSVMLLYPLGHSLILILWNSKLKKVALRVWWKMRCYQKGNHL
ncbi:bitter taste receptor Modo-T2R29 [Monodelphis domestica]|uniref:Taste receptor type 2 n=1 Tax=Monodelphis domestica TaxID=13616 RepID=Q2AB90_MONDO|nr:bitter taste receptor Modo-T2R29 [Monodelphis domestica]BAE80377.1 bitter taste receptor [Monodelphis domestica]